MIACKKSIAICAALMIALSGLAFAAENTDKTGNENESAGTAQATVNGNQVSAVSVGASIQGGNQNTAVGSSVLIVNPGQQNIDIGSVYGALINGGSGNTAIGANAQVVGGNNLGAVGYGAFAGYGDNNTAIGNQAHAGGGFTPQGQQIISGQNIAVGYQAQAYGGGSVAIGAYSVANQPNTVSVGQPGLERRVTNVAAGIYPTDAVNMSQLWDTHDKINRLGATAMAMTGLAPLGYNPKDPTQYSAAVGTYGGHTGFAFGVYHYTHDNVMLNLALGISDDGWEKAGRAGITWRSGGSKKKAVADNTIHGSNVGATGQAAKPPAEEKSGYAGAGSDNIVDRVKRMVDESNKDAI